MRRPCGGRRRRRRRGGDAAKPEDVVRQLPVFTDNVSIETSRANRFDLVAFLLPPSAVDAAGLRPLHLRFRPGLRPSLRFVCAVCHLSVLAVVLVALLLPSLPSVLRPPSNLRTFPFPRDKPSFSFFPCRIGRDVAKKRENSEKCKNAKKNLSASIGSSPGFKRSIGPTKVAFCCSAAVLALCRGCRRVGPRDEMGWGQSSAFHAWRSRTREASAAAIHDGAVAAATWKHPRALSRGHLLQGCFHRRAGCGGGSLREAVAAGESKVGGGGGGKAEEGGGWG